MLYSLIVAVVILALFARSKFFKIMYFLQLHVATLDFRTELNALEQDLAPA